MKKTLKQFNIVIKECKEIFKKKLIDYGLSWKILRESSIIDQIFMKCKRVRNIQNREKDNNLNKKDLIEDLLSIINYSIIAIIQLDNNSAMSKLKYNEIIKLYDSKILNARKLIILKNSDYEDAWRDMNIGSIIDIMLQKILRIKNIKKNNEQTIISENSTSQYLDLLNYTIFTIIKTW